MNAHDVRPTYDAWSAAYDKTPNPLTAIEEIAVRSLLRTIEFSRVLDAAAGEVHRELGPGFEEVIYQRALARELPAHSLEFSREVWIDIHYKGEKVGSKRADFVIDQVMVEIKAKATLEDVDFVQTLSYLKASGYKVGLLINFGAVKLQVKRLVN
jgi:GxxExxY protein